MITHPTQRGGGTTTPLHFHPLGQCLQGPLALPPLPKCQSHRARQQEFLIFSAPTRKNVKALSKLMLYLNFIPQSKPYVLLHPTSYFASNPEALGLNEKDVIETGVGHDIKGPVSASHQLVTFV